MMVYLLSVGVFLAFFLLAGVGVILRGKAIRGSCGGIAVMGSDGEPLTCATCPNRFKGRNKGKQVEKTQNCSSSESVASIS